MVFPVSPIHKDKIARVIPRTKLQHHISREVRGIGFFNEMMKRKKKLSRGIRIYQMAIAAIGVAAGNRIFNHVEAWTGLLVMILCTIFIIYQLIKLLKR